MPEEFFEELQEHSLVKTAIVEKYFAAWSKIMLATLKRSYGSNKNLAYIDLFAGPGVDETGQYSTPIKVIQQCIKNPELCNNMKFLLNDANKEYAATLQTTIESLEGIDAFNKIPKVHNFTIDNSIAKEFNFKMIPSLSFIDPFGYKGLSKELISALVKDFGCDCIFFFNYNRINAAIKNNKVKELINDIFGETLAQKLRDNVSSYNASDRENYIINSLSELFIRENRYVLPFRFQSETRDATSHYIIFVCKHPLGYNIMKEIMANESSQSTDGVASFSYIPTKNQQLSLLFSLSSPLSELQSKILTTFKGRNLTVKEMFDQSSINTPYVMKNYKDVLTSMELAGLIEAKPPYTQRRTRNGKPTMADKTAIFVP